MNNNVFIYLPVFKKKDEFPSYGDLFKNRDFCFCLPSPILSSYLEDALVLIKRLGRIKSIARATLPRQSRFTYTNSRFRRGTKLNVSIRLPLPPTVIALPDRRWKHQEKIGRLDRQSCINFTSIINSLIKHLIFLIRSLA